VECERATFGGGQVLHRMETESCDIRLSTHRKTGHLGTERVGGVRKHQGAAQSHLWVRSIHA
jgi:hypothetical protein